MRRRPFISTRVTLAALAVLIGACAGDDEGDDKPPATPPPAQAPPGGDGAPRPSASQLPPEFIECMAAEGYEFESSADVHSAPPQVLQKCFGSLHGSGGAP